MSDRREQNFQKPPGALISIINRAHFIIINERLKPCGLSAGQFLALICLVRKQNIIQDTLARHFHIDKGTVARAVQKLEDGGFIRRTPDPENRRAVRLFLTEKGREMAPVLHSIDLEWEKGAFSGFTNEEKEQCMVYLRRMAANCISLVQKNGYNVDTDE